MRRSMPSWAAKGAAVTLAVLWGSAFLLAYLAVPSALIGLGVAGIEAYEDWRCGKYSDMTGHPTHYVWFDTCYVERDGRMQPRREYEAVKRYLEVE